MKHKNLNTNNNNKNGNKIKQSSTECVKDVLYIFVSTNQIATKVMAPCYLDLSLKQSSNVQFQ